MRCPTHHRVVKKNNCSFFIPFFKAQIPSRKKTNCHIFFCQVPIASRKKQTATVLATKFENALRVGRGLDSQQIPKHCFGPMREYEGKQQHLRCLFSLGICPLWSISWSVACPSVSARETTKTSSFRPFWSAPFASLGVLVFRESEVTSPACRKDTLKEGARLGCWWGVCGCVGVWVCGCVGVWMCGCVGV